MPLSLTMRSCLPSSQTAIAFVVPLPCPAVVVGRYRRRRTLLPYAVVSRRRSAAVKDAGVSGA